MSEMLTGPSVVRPLREISLGELWREAESLGRIEVDRDWQDTSYSVEIKFSRPSGTRIIAKGSHSDICVAVSRAIDEAREMGAGEKP
jgi:ribosome-associated translation inhibitor RaiA